MNAVSNTQNKNIHGSWPDGSASYKFRRYFRKLLKSKTGTVGFTVVLIVICVAVFAPFLAPHDPAKQNHDAMLVPPAWSEGGSSAYILGTDNLGRDILSRIIYGTRISLLVGLAAVLLAGITGLFIGLFSGYYGGVVDAVFMRIADAFLAIPSILFALVVLSVLGPGISTLVMSLGATQWVVYARLVRSEVLSVKQRDYVKAARSIGVKNIYIIMRHVLPNVFSSFIVVSALAVASTIISEASLSFLGLGIQPPTVSWGVMLSDGRNYLATSWWLATFPGIAITITVLGIIFLGDWVRDVLDPRLQGSR